VLIFSVCTARYEQLPDAGWATPQAPLEIDHEHVPGSLSPYPGREGEPRLTRSIRLILMSKMTVPPE
jgi:hypothetical protein